MRASELLGREVHDGDGRFLGRVIDVRARLDGPSTGSLPAPRVTALILSRHHVGTFLGYQQPGQRGPWLVRVIVERLHRHTSVVDWSSVASADGSSIVLRGSAPTEGPLSADHLS